MGNYWEFGKRNGERERAGFPKWRKKFFITLFCALNQAFSLAVPSRHRRATIKQKDFLSWIKKWRARRTNCEVLTSESDVRFPRKAQVFKEGKNAEAISACDAKRFSLLTGNASLRMLGVTLLYNFYKTTGVHRKWHVTEPPPGRSWSRRSDEP